MAIADASSLLAGVENLIRAAELSPALLSEVALDTIAAVQRSAVASLSGQESQIGFDLEQFLNIISRPGPLGMGPPGVGSIGVFDTELMGTAADFELIANIPGLFHQHTGDRAGIWRNIVYPSEGLREEVALERQSEWRGKQPQWYLLHEGTSGDGAYPDTAPNPFIESVTGPSTIGRVMATLSKVFRGV